MRHGNLPVLNGPTRKKLVEDRRAGMSLRAVGEKYGVSRTTAERYVIAATGSTLSARVSKQESQEIRRRKRQEREANRENLDVSIIEMLSKGSSAKRIAYELDCAITTVQRRVQVLMKENSAHNATHLVAMFLRSGRIV